MNLLLGLQCPRWSPFQILVVGCLVYVLVRIFATSLAPVITLLALAYVYMWAIYSIIMGRRIYTLETHPGWLYVVRAIPLVLYVAVAVLTILKINNVHDSTASQVVIDGWWVFPIVSIIIHRIVTKHVIRPLTQTERHKGLGRNTNAIIYTSFFYPWDI